MILQYKKFIFGKANDLLIAPDTAIEYLYLAVLSARPSYDELQSYYIDAAEISSLESSLTTTDSKSFMYAVQYDDGSYKLAVNYAHILSECIFKNDMDNFPLPGLSALASSSIRITNAGKYDTTSLIASSTRVPHNAILPIIIQTISTAPLSTDLSAIAYAIIFKTSVQYYLVKFSDITNTNVTSIPAPEGIRILTPDLYSQYKPFAHPFIASNFRKYTDYKPIIVINNSCVISSPNGTIARFGMPFSSGFLVGYNNDLKEICIFPSTSTAIAYTLSSGQYTAIGSFVSQNLIVSASGSDNSDQLTESAVNNTLFKMPYTNIDIDINKVYLFLSGFGNSVTSTINASPSCFFTLGDGKLYLQRDTTTASGFRSTFSSSDLVYAIFDLQERQITDNPCSNLYHIHFGQIPYGIDKDFKTPYLPGKIQQTAVVFPSTDLLLVSSFPAMDEPGNTPISLDSNGYPTTKYKFKYKSFKGEVRVGLVINIGTTGGYTVNLRSMINANIIRTNMKIITGFSYITKSSAPNTVATSQYATLIDMRSDGSIYITPLTSYNLPIKAGSSSKQFEVMQNLYNFQSSGGGYYPTESGPAVLLAPDEDLHINLNLISIEES